MKKLILLLCLTSSAMAADVSFEQTAKSGVHPEFISNELCKAKNALTEYLSDQNCTRIKIRYDVRSGGMFRKNEFSFEGLATCPASIDGLNVSVELAPCEECSSVTSVILFDANGNTKKRQLTTSETKYLCQ